MIIRKSAQKDLRSIPKKQAQAILDKLEQLEQGAGENLDVCKLQGQGGLYRLRHGNYRAIFTHDYVLILVRVRSRQSAYRNVQKRGKK